MLFRSFWISISGGIALTGQRQPNPIVKQGIYTGKHVKDSSQLLEYAKQWTTYEANQHSGLLNKAKNVEALNAVADQRQIRVINIDSANPVPHRAAGEWPVRDQNFFDWAYQKNKPRTNWGHFFESTHQEFAQYCLNFIK